MHELPDQNGSDIPKKKDPQNGSGKSAKVTDTAVPSVPDKPVDPVDPVIPKKPVEPIHPVDGSGDSKTFVNVEDVMDVIASLGFEIDEITPEFAKQLSDLLAETL